MQALDYGIPDGVEDQPGYKTDAEIDRWHDGALDALRGTAKRGEDPDYLEGYAHGENQRQIRVVMPRRPEGYYHAPIGTFD